LERLSVSVSDSEYFLPGDIFHSDPAILELFGLHHLSHSGRALAGNGDIGITALRLQTPTKEIKYNHDGSAIIHIDHDTSRSQLTPTIWKSFQNQQQGENNFIRLFLKQGSSKKSEVLYMGHVFPHCCFFSEKKQRWILRLKLYHREAAPTMCATKYYLNCPCCEGNKL
jgi:hypothetical protein